MYQIFSQDSNPALLPGQMDFVFSFMVAEESELFVVISGQLQYSGISYSLLSPESLRMKHRLRGSEIVEVFTVGVDPRLNPNKLPPIEAPDGVRRLFHTLTPFNAPLIFVEINGVILGPNELVFPDNQSFQITAGSPPVATDVISIITLMRPEVEVPTYETILPEPEYLRPVPPLQRPKGPTLIL